ncbi:hypothetical protein HPB52_024268 [Rhipicephalus sanguineus]|uniref:RING-CH-type domain-containing protein n=1 Tax=Rhipicephalus sanguineus TaxID=34632 RepID=A0A9D4YS21_RHISA|nr:hypothetical protein HPB52_024268 [Rhipicephalus sanguineus]
MPNDGYRALIEDAPTQPSAVSAPSGTKSHCSRLCEIAIRIPHSRAHRRRSFRKDDVPILDKDCHAAQSSSSSTSPPPKRRGACPELSFDLGSSPSCTPKGFLVFLDSSPEHEERSQKNVIVPPTDLMLPCAISTDATSTFESGLECSGSAPNTPAGCLNVTTSSGPMCRICHEGDQTESLMSLCRCSGTMGLLHVSCLERWLNARNVDHCELCHHRFPTAAQPTCLRQFFHSVWHGHSQLIVLGDVLCFAILTLLVALSCFLCAQSAFKYAHEGRVMEAASLVTLAGLLATGYSVWAFRTARFHYRAFAVWEAVNPMRRILAPPFSSGEGGHDRATAGQPTGLREMVDVVAGNAETERTTQRRGGGGQRLPLELPPNTLPEGSLPALQQPVYALGPMANFEYW